MIFSSLGSNFGAEGDCQRAMFSQRLQPCIEKRDTYPWLVSKVVCVNSRLFGGRDEKEKCSWMLRARLERKLRMKLGVFSSVRFGIG